MKVMETSPRMSLINTTREHKPQRRKADSGASAIKGDSEPAMWPSRVHEAQEAQGPHVQRATGFQGAHKETAATVKLPWVWNYFSPGARG